MHFNGDLNTAACPSKGISTPPLTPCGGALTRRPRLRGRNPPQTTCQKPSANPASRLSEHLRSHPWVRSVHRRHLGFRRRAPRPARREGLPLGGRVQHQLEFESTNGKPAFARAATPGPRFRAGHLGAWPGSPHGLPYDSAGGIGAIGTSRKATPGCACQPCGFGPFISRLPVRLREAPLILSWYNFWLFWSVIRTSTYLASCSISVLTRLVWVLN